MSGLVFLNPWGFAAAASLAAVGVIYIFHRRFRPRVVSGLFLWDDPDRLRRGGRKRERLRVTRSLLLDLLACALLSAAMAEPALLRRAEGNVAIVVDTSLSMKAAGNALRAVDTALGIIRSAAAGARFTVVSAGKRPRVLCGDAPVLEALSAVEALEFHEPADSVAEAVERARETSAGRLSLHVITDHEPAVPVPDSSVMKVHVFRGRYANPAVVKAERIRPEAPGGPEMLFLGVGNPWDEAAEARLSVREDGAELFGDELLLAAGAVRYFTFALPADSGEVTVRLEAEEDALGEDSIATLIPEPEMRVTFEVEEGAPAAEAARRALRACGAFPAAAGEVPDILVTGGRTREGGCMTVRVTGAEGEVPSFLGPFVVDTAHPLCRDVDLSGLYWPADKTHVPERMMQPLISVGDIPLYYLETESSAVLNLAGEGGNLPRSPAWPVLFADLFRYARDRLPGLHSANYVPGDTLDFVPRADAGTAPRRISGEGLDIEINGPVYAAPVPERPGGYALLDAGGGETGRIRVNCIVPPESDLRALSAADREREEAGSGAEDSPLRPWGIAWAALLLAACAFGLNWTLDRLEKR